MDVIFQKTTCLKKEVFSKIVNLMIGAGWENVSSNTATDFTVLKSTGESGDKELVFNIRATSNTNANSIETTDYNVMSIRLIGGYVPGSPGVAGTFDRADTWRPLYIVPTATAMGMENEMTIWYHVNRNRIIFIIESPSSLAVSPVTHYIGLPESFINEPKSKGLIWAASASAVTASTILITENADTLAPGNVSVTRNSYVTLPPKSPNSDGIHTPVPMLYGSSTEGWRGRIDGIFCLPVGAAANGDELTVGTKTFRVVVNGVSGNNSFITTTLAFQIS